MEENLAYDQGPVQASTLEKNKKKESNGTRRRKTQEDGDCRDPLPEEVREGSRLAIRLSGTDTMGGMYALLLISLGIAFPVSEYTSSEKDARMRDNFDTGFRLYVYIVGLLFQLYISIAVHIHNRVTRNQARKHSDGTSNGNGAEIETSFGGRHLRKKTGSKGELYVIEDGSGEDNPKKEDASNISGVPWHLWAKMAPPIYETKYGFNLFTRAGILVFGLCAVALDICRLVEYAQSVNTQCYIYAFGALIVIRMLFFVSQIIFLFFHHKVVLNFHHPLIKIGLVHLVATNIIAWVKMIAYAAIDILQLAQVELLRISANDHHSTNTSHGTTVDPHGSSAGHGMTTIGHGIMATSHHGYSNYTTHAPDAAGPAGFAECLKDSELVIEASRHLGPLVIGYCVLAASVLYRMYTTIGPNTYILGQPLEIWERNRESSNQRESGNKPKSRRPNLGLVLGIPMFLVTLGLTIWAVILDRPNEQEDYRRQLGILHTACDLTLNIIILVALAPAFYSLHKLRYLHHEVTTIEHLLSAVLGGTFILLGFMTVAAFMYINDKDQGGRAKMAVPGCLLNFIQSTAMFAFTADAMRRRLRNVDQVYGKDAITFLIWGNFSMWLVTSFMSKTSFGSYLFYQKFSILPWVLIINTTLPLAMFFRFLTCIILTNVLRTTYGTHVRRYLNVYAE